MKTILRKIFMFGFIQKKITNLFHHLSSKLQSIFSRNTIDQQALKELEEILLTADVGTVTTQIIVSELQKHPVTNGQELQAALATILQTMITQPLPTSCTVYLLVGINGSGKTTFAGKLAHLLTTQGNTVLMVAGDTFRAAATAQLQEWASRTGSDIVIGKSEQDPASVVFAGCQQFKQGSYTHLIIDTAGRLQTKINLMHELEKIKRTINKQLPDAKICTLLTIDSMLGQNSFEQAQLFAKTIPLDGIVLTKIDGGAKGGIVLRISHELKIPVMYLSYGEQPDQLKLFNPEEFIDSLLSK